MGAWGPGAFHNDVALDFAARITTAQDLADALIIRTPEQEIDADTGCRVLVVAECVAAMRGHPGRDMPADLSERLAGFGKASRSLFHHTRDHLAAVCTRGELMELWAETDPAAFNLTIHDLLERLNLPSADATPPGPTTKEPIFNPSPCSFCNQVMGDDEFSEFSIRLDHGQGEPITRGGWAHHRCLNAALHPKHMIRHYRNPDPIEPEEIDRLLERPPTVEEG